METFRKYSKKPVEMKFYWTNEVRMMKLFFSFEMNSL